MQVSSYYLKEGEYITGIYASFLDHDYPEQALCLDHMAELGLIIAKFNAWIIFDFINS